MIANNDIPTVPLDDFIRRFASRESRVMWFLGAGASASAGLPTAFDMILRFKRDLYTSQSGGHQPAQADLSQPALLRRINAYIASLEGLPPPGDKDEYGALFERAYPEEKDRQSLIHSLLAGGKPSSGHIALAALMHKGLARMIWTTNFDTLVADACAKVYDGTGALTTATLDAPDLAADAIQHERWPLEVKLHGDFRSRRLKNTSDELRKQDTQLRELLQSSCRRLGLVVVGYSGRDESIMRTLTQVTEERGSFPGGLFWLRREDDPVFESVRDLVCRAKDAGAEAALVTIHSFDETLRDVAKFVGADEEVQRRPRAIIESQATQRPHGVRLKIGLAGMAIAGLLFLGGILATSPDLPWVMFYEDERAPLVPNGTEPSNGGAVELDELSIKVLRITAGKLGIPGASFRLGNLNFVMREEGISNIESSLALKELEDVGLVEIHSPDDSDWPADRVVRLTDTFWSWIDKNRHLLRDSIPSS